jgi:hypothetical protein
VAAFVKRSSKRSSRAKTVNILKGGDQDFGSLLNSACTLGTNGALAGSHWILSLRWLVTGERFTPLEREFLRRRQEHPAPIRMGG